MVPMAGIGPATSPLPRECSTTELYGPDLTVAERSASSTSHPFARIPTRSLERATGVEPASSAWKAEVLPLNYARRALEIHCLVEGVGFEPT